MDGQKPAQNSAWYQQNNFRNPREIETFMDASGMTMGRSGVKVLSESATIPEEITENDAQRSELDYFRSVLLRDALVRESRITIAQFVEHKFIPERVSRMRYSGQHYYRAMLKHVLKPEEVNRAFNVDPDRSKARVESIPDWPYLGEIRLCDARPDHIQRLISAALERGYSSHTVTHIRNVVVSIFSHAQKEQHYLGKNPASVVTLSKTTSRKEGILTLAQTREVIRAMQYPEREITLFTILTGMSAAEICGLQWGDVNLTDWSLGKDSEAIPAKSIAIRRQWYRGQLERVTGGRVRHLPISQPLLYIFRALKQRASFTGPDDFVLVSRVGTPINLANLVARRLKQLANELNMPSLSWQVFRRTHKALSSEFGARFQEVLADTESPQHPKYYSINERWHCRTERSRMHLEWN